jgi:hypothetical protein
LFLLSYRATYQRNENQTPRGLKRVKPGRVSRLLTGLACLLPAWLTMGLFRLAPWDRSDYALPWAAIILASLPVPELLLAAAAARFLAARGPRFRILGGWLLSLLLGLFAAWSVGEWFYRFFYREHVALMRDLRLLPGMVNMLFSGGGAAGEALGLASYTAALLAALLLGRAFFLLLQYAARLFPSAPSRRAVPFAAALTLAALQYALIPGDAPLPLFIASLAGPGINAVGQAVAAPGDAASPSVPQAAEQESASLEAEPPLLPDLHVFIVESYGHTLFTRDGYRQAMEGVYADFSEFLSGRGWKGASSFLSSPAFGGRSWLADATLLAGIRLRNQEHYDAYLLSGSRNLSHRLGELGYYRILAASGTQYTTPEWEALHEFDRYLLQKDFGYRGPFITFGRMPDQYLLYQSAKLFPGLQAPLFGWYMLSNSHVPFEAQPEYVDDWDSLGDGGIFRDANVRYFNNNWLWGGEFPEGYLFSIEYELRIIREFMARYLDPYSLVIILGDHQPRIPISEPDASFSVPIHVLSGKAALIEAFVERGFQPRMVPENEALPHRGMEDFSRLLLEVLATRDNARPD